MQTAQTVFNRVLIACAAALTCALAGAQDYPSKPVRVIVPFATGGGSDITARNMSQRLTGELNQQFIVENKPGAGGVVGLETLIKSPPDGYTIMISTSSWSTAAALSKPSFDPVSDIAPVIEIGFNPLVLSLHPSVPAKNPRELIALAKARPGQLAYATPGIGAITHLAMELMIHMAKIDLLSVPYKSTGATTTDLLAGRTQLILGGLVPLQPFIQAGRLRAIAVTTAKRWPSLPDVAAMAEALPGYEVESWFGIVMPKGVPPAVLERMNAAANKILRDPEVKRNLEGEGMAIVGGSAEQFSRRIRNDHSRWVKLVKDAGLKGE
jgi:tripartite-type tricarboxylate transporter receptor subunit TctC